MFEVGFTEILLIFGIALLVLGPERLPKLAADVGRWAGRARAMARQLRTQLEQEVHFDPLRDQPSPAQPARAPAPTVVADAPSPNAAHAADPASPTPETAAPPAVNVAPPPDATDERNPA
jgi:sec-independent protein translocase protein TatB